MSNRRVLVFFCILLGATGALAQHSELDHLKQLLATEFFYAIERNDTAAVTRMFDEINPNGLRAWLSIRTSPLILAAASGSADVVKYLVDKPTIDVNVAQPDGRTALIAAVDTATGKFVDGKAQLEDNPRFEIVKILSSHPGIRINAKDKYGRAALSYAASSPLARMAQVLIEHGVDINTVDNMGRTPLMTAFINYSYPVVELLISKGADPHKRDNKGMTARDYALRYPDKNNKKEFEDMLDLLERHMMGKPD